MRTPLSCTVVVMSCALIAVSAMRASAQAVSCPPNLNGGTVASVHVTGSTCEITNTRVDGDIEVLGGAVGLRDSSVGGDISSIGGTVQLSGGVTVEGDLWITQAQGDSGFLGDNNTIRGVVRYWKNSGYFTAHSGLIGRGMTIENNTGGASLVGNAVQNGDLVCHNNTPPPTGFDNQVNGRRVGQCSRRLRGQHAADTQVSHGTLRRDPTEKSR